MTPIHTLCLFLSGYIASRLLVEVGGHRRVVSKLLKGSQGHPERLLLALMVGCATLSLLIPNALTVLAVIPIVELLTHRRPSPQSSEPQRPLSPGAVTALGLAVIYGANIGGTGSLVGSPANLYLLFSLEVLAIPGRSSIHFLSWLIFGIPLVGLLLFPAWGVIPWVLSLF